MAGRPFKCRMLSSEVVVDYYKPRGVPLRNLEEVILELDEFEAVKLADLEEMYQADAAEKMQVSRQTFGNIIRAAHKKIADAIVNGKAIRIETADVDSESGEQVLEYRPKSRGGMRGRRCRRRGQEN